MSNKARSPVPDLACYYMKFRQNWILFGVNKARRFLQDEVIGVEVKLGVHQTISSLQLSMHVAMQLESNFTPSSCQRKPLYNTWKEGGPAGACYGVSPSGWMEEIKLPQLPQMV